MGGMWAFIIAPLVGIIAWIKEGIAVDNGSVEIHNSILWANSLSAVEINLLTSGSAMVNHSIVMGGFQGEGIFNGRPGFNNPASGDYSLQDWSPAIGRADTANYGEYASLDLLGNARTYSDTTWGDLGALEHGFSNPDLTQYTTRSWVVSTTGNDSTGLGTVSEPFSSIQQGVNFALYSDTVAVIPGTYFENIKMDGKAIAIKSSGSNTIIDGNQTGSVLSLLNGGSETTHLEGLVIQNGQAEFGGGLYLQNTAATIENVMIQANLASQKGGGVFSFFDDSTAAYSVAIMNSEINNNSASVSRGGLSLSNHTVTISNCEINNNQSDGNGGLWIGGSSTTFEVSDCIIAGNQANTFSAGGSFSGGATGVVKRTVITNNSANIAGSGDYSGGLTVWNNADVTFENCAFVNNNAGIGAGLSVGNGANATARNCVFWGNTPDQLALLTWNNQGGDLTISYSDVEGGESSVNIADAGLSNLTWGVGNLDVEPATQSGNTALLLARSLLINAGDPDNDGDGVTWDSDPDDQDSDGTRMDIGVYPYLNTFTGPNFHVVAEGNDSTGTGSMDYPFATIQAGINFALESDTVRVGPGVYQETVRLRDYNIAVLGIRGQTTINPQGIGTGMILDGSYTSATLIDGFHFTGGVSSQSGGGMFITGGSPTISHNRFSGNTDDTKGAGIAIGSGSPLLEYNMIVQNNGHGIYIDSNGQPELINNTIANNSGTGVYSVSSLSSPGRNNILWNNNAGLTGPFVFTYSDIQEGATGTGNINTDPLFVNGPDGDYRLDLLSPCLDAGDPTDPFDDDSTVVDMGALPNNRSFVSGNTGGENVDVTADTIVIVSNDLVVESGDTLNLEPGSTLYFEAGVTLTLNGFLNASGDVTEPVLFTTLDPTEMFGGIILNTSSGRDVNVFSHVLISNVDGNSIPLTVNGSATLEHFTIAGNGNDTSLVVSGGTVNLDYSILEGIAAGSVIISESYTQSTDQFVDPANNDFNLIPTALAIDIWHQ